MLTDKHWGPWNVRAQNCSFKERNVIPITSPETRGDMHSSLVTFVLSVWLETTQDPPPDPYQEPVFLRQSRKPIIMEGVTDTLQSTLSK